MVPAVLATILGQGQHCSQGDALCGYCGGNLGEMVAKFDFSYIAEHLPGKSNAAADALSRDNLSLFHSLNPQAAREQTPVPPTLALLLMDHTPQWTSLNWAGLFRDSLSRV
uniref:Uncharacterized protein n=1 Tax=Amphimedon queenslandica TaxID=400682 RepID=A0A1X7USV4_AMPQE